MINEARRLATTPTQRYDVADASHLPYESGAFELVTMNNVIPFFDELARVTAPTRIVWGRQDKIIPVECGTLYQQAIPGADLVVLEQCGHASHLEKPDEFVRVALDFLP